MMEQKKILLGILLSAVVICCVSCGAAEITKENDEIDFAAYFEQYDEMLGNDELLDSYTSYDVREMEHQIDGFWDYYECYEKARQEGAMISEDGNYCGRYYTVGENISEGMYLVLSMDTQEGTISCGGNEPPCGHHIGAPFTRFRYMILVRVRSTSQTLSVSIPVTTITAGQGF